MTDDDRGTLLFTYRGLTLRIDAGVQPPKAGSLLFARSLEVRPGERVLEIGSGAGLASIMAARAGASVLATDVRPEAVRCTRGNAARNRLGHRVEAREGDAFAPVAGLVFDVVCTSPPQMPTPPGRERDDAEAAADNGGADGWALLDRVIHGAPAHLAPGGRLVFSLFAFLGVDRAHEKLRAVGLVPSIVAREAQAFPRIGYERLDHLRAIDDERTIPRDALPSTVDRYVLMGRRPT